MEVYKRIYPEVVPQLSPLGLIVIDYENRRVVQSDAPNQKAYFVSREAFHSLLKEAFSNLIIEEDREKFLGSFNSLAEAKIGEVVEALCRTRDEESKVKWVHFRSMVVEKDEEGKPLRTICCGHDISNVKNVEQQLREKVEAMEALKVHGLNELKEPVASILQLVGMLDEDKLSSQVDKLIIQYLHRTVSKLHDALMKAA